MIRVAAAFVASSFAVLCSPVGSVTSAATTTVAASPVATASGSPTPSPTPIPTPSPSPTPAMATPVPNVPAVNIPQNLGAPSSSHLLTNIQKQLPTSPSTLGATDVIALAIAGQDPSSPVTPQVGYAYDSLRRIYATLGILAVPIADPGTNAAGYCTGSLGNAPLEYLVMTLDSSANRFTSGYRTHVTFTGTLMRCVPPPIIRAQATPAPKPTATPTHNKKPKAVKLSKKRSTKLAKADPPVNTPSPTPSPTPAPTSAATQTPSPTPTPGWTFQGVGRSFTGEYDHIYYANPFSALLEFITFTKSPWINAHKDWVTDSSAVLGAFEHQSDAANGAVYCAASDLVNNQTYPDIPLGNKGYLAPTNANINAYARSAVRTVWVDPLYQGVGRVGQIAIPRCGNGKDVSKSLSPIAR